MKPTTMTAGSHASSRPSRELHADRYGKNGPPVGWAEFRKRYMAEMLEEGPRIATLAARIASGEVLTLLCSSACVDPDHCHRTLLKALLEKQLVGRR